MPAARVEVVQRGQDPDNRGGGNKKVAAGRKDESWGKAWKAKVLGKKPVSTSTSVQQSNAQAEVCCHTWPGWVQQSEHTRHAEIGGEDEMRGFGEETGQM